MKLEGVRVIDLSLFLPGPYLTLALADHGAEVIKVEPPGEGDPTRHLGLSDGDSTVYFRNLNRGKKSVVMDLKKPEEREALLRLCESADVFVESFRPGVVERLGVSYEQVSARNPRIVYCSISAFGQQGPLRDRPAHDLAVESLSGVISLNLGQDGKPTIPALPSRTCSARCRGFPASLWRSFAASRREKATTWTWRCTTPRSPARRTSSCRRSPRTGSQSRGTSAPREGRRSTASMRPPTAAISRSAARR